jgi:hypothetical protein
MANIKPIDRIASKWATVSGRSGSEYEEGVRNPRNDWQRATAAANATWKAAVSQAVSQDRFAAGVSRTPTARWQENAVSKGVSRYSAGVQLAQTAYQEGFAPYAEVIRGVTLPPRGPKGDPQNINRVATIAKALHDAKMRRGGQR